jgi:hypothetical protein
MDDPEMMKAADIVDRLRERTQLRFSLADHPRDQMVDLNDIYGAINEIERLRARASAEDGPLTEAVIAAAIEFRDTTSRVKAIVAAQDEDDPTYHWGPVAKAEYKLFEAVAALSRIRKEGK